ncbi:glycosyltransferase family 4 protein [Robertmurraya korlensis]|uniref:glycosyltransferase family 4 protein n=1 Tax=Robertmurraya korlensis TaxID=519977 RepID=UPI000826BAA4|nr:glycosyltransferase family 4 protein [Robertmurraya korlensis]
MRIVQISPDVYPIPPNGYGGIENVVYDLTEELVKRGHEVYVYAPRESTTSAKLIPYLHNDPWQHSRIVKRVKRTLPNNIDIIHDHTHDSLIGRLNLPIPTISTIHVDHAYAVENRVFISKRAREYLGSVNEKYVHNGIIPSSYEFSCEKEDYVLFLSRLTREKGLGNALDVVEKTNDRLIIAGPIHDYPLFEGEYKPRIESNPNVEYIGMVAGKQKQEILKRAKCMLFPIDWEEPFGLVMIEAMACGTPVLAFPKGSVPEILEGFPQLICHTVEEMIEKVRENSFPYPDQLRRYVIERFSVSRMTDEYLAIYNELIAKNNR